MRLRRSDFSVARYAFSLVLANFGIAIAARMPMITTTISSSISVKPLRFTIVFPPDNSSQCRRQSVALCPERSLALAYVQSLCRATRGALGATQVFDAEPIDL